MSSISSLNVYPYVPLYTDLTTRWDRVEDGKEHASSVRGYVIHADENFVAWQSYLSGSVPEKGADLASLVKKMTFRLG